MIIGLRLKLAMAVRVRDVLLTNPFDSELADRVIFRFVEGVGRAQALLAQLEIQLLAPGTEIPKPEVDHALLLELQAATRELMRLLVRLDGIARFWFRGKPELMETWVNARRIAWTPRVREEALRGPPVPDTHERKVEPIAPA